MRPVPVRHLCFCLRAPRACAGNSVCPTRRPARRVPGKFYAIAKSLADSALKLRGRLAMALDYDNSAFYYFSMTMLGIYVIPATFWALHYVFCQPRRGFFRTPAFNC
mmetsp:Transcript_17909/g.55833  ORF Transcript_17909/g.55833 Transcript_17909/m.55833 type:complete len:107 (+) Transcript_17909:44-364(+)